MVTLTSHAERIFAADGRWDVLSPNKRGDMKSVIYVLLGVIILVLQFQFEHRKTGA